MTGTIALNAATLLTKRRVSNVLGLSVPVIKVIKSCHTIIWGYATIAQCENLLQEQGARIAAELSNPLAALTFRLSLLARCGNSLCAP